MTEKRCTCGEQTLCQCPVHRPDDQPVFKDAGHRHAKDFVGHSLYIGDTVAITFRRGGKGSKWVLLVADVVNITPKGVRVITEDDGYELVREECQVMKLRQP